MNKTILLTGVSKGLGAELARQLLDDGYNVIGIARNKTSAVEELQIKFNDSYTFFSLDIGSHADCQRFFQNEEIKSVKFDGFVNNAAIAYDDLVTNANIEPLEKMFQINVIHPILMCRFVIRNMLLNRTPGSIVHISSISVHTGYKGLSMYAATKGAIEAFSKNVAREWGSLKVRSNCVVAGFMETEMSAGLTEEQKNRIYQRTSLKSETSVKSVAATVRFLLSDASNSITGQNIFVDSGTI